MYESLYELVEPHCEKRYLDLPEEVRVRVNSDFVSHGWDGLTPGERSSLAKELDAQWEMSPQAFWFKLQGQILDTERKISELELEDPQSTPATREAKLGELKANLVALHDEWRQSEKSLAESKVGPTVKSRTGHHPEILEIQEGLRFLTENTGLSWTEAQLLSLASKCGIGLYASVPPWTSMYIVDYGSHGFSSRPYLKPGCSVFAALPSDLVEEAWIGGATQATSVASASFSVGDEQVYFTDPVAVKRSDLRLTRAKLLEILKSWEDSRRPLLPALLPLVPASTPTLQLAGSALPEVPPRVESGVADSSLKSRPNDSWSEKPTWAAKAQEVAKEYIDRHKAGDLYPSQKDVCAHVEARLRADHVFGPHGRPLSAAYIGRNALQGEWWKTNKP